MEQKGKDLGIKRPGEDLDKHGEKTIKFSTEDLPIGISSIVDMLSTPYYVDKTEHAYELLHGISKYIFLSRPRRFGKSLFVSTLEEIAKGNKELFKNCWIGQSNYDWKKYPVIRLNFSDFNNTTTEQLERDLIDALDDIALKYNVEISGSSHQTKLKRLVNKLIELDSDQLIALGSREKKQVVVLIDEYDTPFINVEDDNIKKGNLKVVRDFLTVLKGLSDHIKLEFVTGVSAYCFKECRSGPNNLDDITLDPDYATVAGYREEDLLQEASLYKQRINDLATKKKLTPEAIISHMRSKYNGYKFSPSEGTISVYNPWSTLKFLKHGRLNNYWYDSGTPSFLIQKAGVSYFEIDFSKDIVTTESVLISPKFNQLSTVGLMFQGGYLTIDKYRDPLAPGTLESDTLPLLVKFPNDEVKDSFYDSLLAEISNIVDASIKSKDYALPNKIIKSLSDVDLDSFIKVITTFFSGIPYNLSQPHQNKNEAYYHTVLHSLLECSGMQPKNEDYTNKGRIDIVVNSLPHVTYIFELKHGKNATFALDQINNSSYEEKFLDKNKGIVVVGINFSSKERNITEFTYECYDEGGNITTEDAIVSNYKTTRFKSTRSHG